MSLKVIAFVCVLLVAAAESLRTRIIGGNEAQPHEFPHMVIIVSGIDHKCGGAILNENWIITAGHCVERFLEIKAGKHSLKTFETSTEQVIDVELSHIYQKYGRSVDAHDIALLKLKEPLKFNKYVQPIALPEKNTEFSGQVIFSGWGMMEHKNYPDKLRKAKMNVIDFEACQKADILTSNAPSSLVSRTNLCTESSLSRAFACTLDSGSPLIKKDGDKTTLVGIFSWLIHPCGTMGAPSVFTKVSAYVDWIEYVMANNSD